jgi:hypothetical protein
MSDRDRLLTLLEEAGPAGIHSHEIRRRGISGHPSQRAKELEEQGYPIRREREFVGNRPGVRFFLEESAGDGAGSVTGRQPASAVPGGSSEEPARLFTPPAQNPLTDREAA